MRLFSTMQVVETVNSLILPFFKWCAAHFRAFQFPASQNNPQKVHLAVAENGILLPPKFWNCKVPRVNFVKKKKLWAILYMLRIGTCDLLISSQCVIERQQNMFNYLNVLSLSLYYFPSLTELSYHHS